MKKHIGWILALSFPILNFLHWHEIDQSYPRNDEAFYFNLTHELVYNFERFGFQRGMDQLYFHKHWKPILHPVAAVPIVAILKNASIPTALTAVLFCFWLVFLIFNYRLFRERISTAGAVLSVWIISVLPWIFDSTTTFNSELPFLAAVSGFIYYLAKSEFLSRKTGLVGAGIWFAIAAMVRPVEAGMIFSFPLLFLFFRNWKVERFSPKDFFLVGSWFVLGACALLPPYFVFTGEWSKNVVFIWVGILIAHFLLISWLQKKWKFDSLNIQFSKIAFFPTLVWFVPGAWTLFFWIYYANLGDMAFHTGKRAGRPLTEFLSFYLNALGPAVLVFLAVALLIRFLNNKEKVTEKHFPFLSLFILSCLVPLAIGSLSYNGDVRYYYANWWMLFVLTCIVLFQGRHRLRWLPSVVAVFFFSAYTLRLAQYRYPQIGVVVQSYSSYMGFSFFNPQPRPYDATEDVVRAIDEIAPTASKVRKVTVIATENLGWVSITVDPWALQVFARSRGVDFIMYRPELYDQRSPEKILEDVKKDSDLIMVGPLNGAATSTEGSVQILAKQLIESKGLAGLELKGQIQALTPNREVRTFLVFVTNRIVPPNEDPTH